MTRQALLDLVERAAVVRMNATSYSDDIAEIADIIAVLISVLAQEIENE